MDTQLPETCREVEINILKLMCTSLASFEEVVFLYGQVGEKLR